VGDGEYAAEQLARVKQANYEAAARYLQARYGSGGVPAWLSPGETVAVARYASGGYIPAAGTTARNTTGHGERVTSIDGYPVTPEEPEPAVVPGSVTGYRWWTLPAPDWTADPGEAEQNWPHGKLHGVQDNWQPGANTAACRGGYTFPSDPHHLHQAPAKNCSCGFWAYWQPEHRSMGSYTNTIPVFGAIQAWGRTRLAVRGFRAQKARILAVHLPFTLLPEAPGTGGLWPGWNDGRPQLGGHEVRTLRDGRRLLMPAGITQDGAQACADHAEAWIAVIGDRLACDYGVRAFETRDALLACFPPDPVRGSQPCRHCELPGGRHQEQCPVNAGWTARGGTGTVNTVHTSGGSGGSSAMGGGGGGSSWSAPPGVYGAGGSSGVSSGLAQWHSAASPGSAVFGSPGGSAGPQPGSGSAGGSH
jgi:hypothetical protein